MTRVEMMSSSLSSPAVSFKEFMHLQSKYKNCFGVFFEGEDEKYYSIRINTYADKINWRPIVCKGKQNVLTVRKMVRTNKQYQDSLCMFFVDADFDDNSHLESLMDTYITPCYSIENLYVTERTLTSILSAEFSLTELCEEHLSYQNCLLKFNELKSKFLDCVRDFNHIVKCIRCFENENDTDGKLNINNIKIDDLVKIGIDSVERVYGDEPSLIFKDYPKNEELIELIQETPYSFTNPEAQYRGKQNIEFMRKFLTIIKSDRTKRQDRVIFEHRGNVSLQLSKENILSELSNYAETPESLKVFLSRHSQVSS